MGFLARASLRQIAALCLLLVWAFAAAQCGSSVQATGGAGVSLVLGVEAACASLVEEIDLEVTSNRTVELQQHYGGGAPLALPIAVAFQLPTSGAEHTASATFTVDPGRGQPKLMQTLNLSIADGTSGRIVLSLPCVCIG